jgi:Uma2 family endonuclease
LVHHYNIRESHSFVDKQGPKGTTPGRGVVVSTESAAGLAVDSAAAAAAGVTAGLAVDSAAAAAAGVTVLLAADSAAAAATATATPGAIISTAAAAKSQARSQDRGVGPMVKSSRGDNLYSRLEALPEHLVGEIVDGELVVSPRPALRHALASSSIHGDVFTTFGRGSRAGWWILFEPELHLGADVLIPDIAGWRRERLPTMPDAAYATLAPDWVCEILSPRTAALDRVRKMPIYAREGVPHLWLGDPGARTLEVFALQESHWGLQSAHEGKDVVHAPPFEEAALDLSLWWAPEADQESSPAEADQESSPAEADQQASPAEADQQPAPAEPDQEASPAEPKDADQN